MQFNPIKSTKNSFLNFIRYFYDPNFQYVDSLFKELNKKIVRFVLNIALTGLVGWLVILSILQLTPATWPILGPGVRHILNIFQIGLIVWCFEKIFRFIRRGTK